jgi:hypothetical protein
MAAGGGDTLRAGQAVIGGLDIGRFRAGWCCAVLGNGGEIGTPQHAGNERGYELC